MTWAKCGNCGKSAFAHKVATSTKKNYTGSMGSTTKRYAECVPFGRSDLSDGQLLEAELALTSFATAPSDYKPSVKSIHALKANDTELGAVAKPKTQTVYLADGRWFESLQMAQAAGGVIHKATTKWVIA